MNIIISIITTFILFFNYKLDSINDIFTKPLYVVIPTFIIILLINIKIKEVKLDKRYKVFSILYSLVYVISNSFSQTSETSLLFDNIYYILITILSIFIYYKLFNKVIYLLLNIFNRKITTKNKLINKIADKLDKKPFIYSFIIIIIFWLLYIIAFYPIILSPDPSFQIKQFFNVKTKYATYVQLLEDGVYMTRHHPVIHTLLLGSFIKIGRLFNSDNLGLFLYSIMQITVLASTLAYTIKFLKKYKVSKLLRLITLVIYSLVPMYAFYAMSGVKDTIYTSLVIVLVMLLYDFIKEKISVKKTIFTILISLLIILFRNNGIFIILFSFPIVLLLKNNRKKVLIVLVSTLSLFSTYNHILDYYKISEGSIREALSIPFQQTARYVKYDNDLTQDEIETIDTVLTYDTLASRYDPKKADSVKNEYNKFTTDEELKDYFRVWYKCLLRNPKLYVDSVINNTYGYLYSLEDNWYIYYKYNSVVTEDNLVDYSYNNLDGLRTFLSYYGISFRYIPIIGLISNIGFNSFILLLLGLYLLKDNKKYLIVLIPMYVTLLVCFASPVNTYFRYAMPYIFGMPLIVCLFKKD